jgi:DNA polymerase I
MEWMIALLHAATALRPEEGFGSSGKRGRAVAYIDCTSAEFGIAAALSDDARMKCAYESGDVYMAFAIDAKAAPTGATKYSHPEVRKLYKLVVLAVQYGQGAASLAETLGVQQWRAQELLDLHRRVYDRYWQWSEWVSQVATFRRTIETVFPWPMHVTAPHEAKHHLEFPHAGSWRRNAALGLHLCYWGGEVHAPVQDALLIGGPSEEIEDVVAATRTAMAEASDLVLDGFELRSDVNIVR